MVKGFKGERDPGGGNFRMILEHLDAGTEWTEILFIGLSLSLSLTQMFFMAFH